MQRRAVWIAIGIVVVSAAGCRKGAANTGAAAPAANGAGAIGARGPYGSNYRPPSGEFTIQIPDVPQMHEEADGRTVYQVRTERYAYTINKLACPAAFAGTADPRVLYDQLRDASVTAVGGELISERDLDSFGRTLAGREVVVQAITPRTGEPYEMLIRLFRDGESVWLLQAIGPREATSRLDRLGVLNSFTLE